MTKIKIDPDSLIFDMDGTLWDAIDSYARIWDTTFAEAGLKRPPVTRRQLMDVMGMHLEDILPILAPEIEDKDAFMQRLDRASQEMMPRLGGKFYPGVQKTIAALAPGRRLFMVSNCGRNELDNFIRLAGIRPYITEALSHGDTGLPKADNISRLIRDYSLRSPYYVGDTQGDADAAAAAGAKMIFCAYGFGHVAEPDITISCFNELKDIVVLH